MISISDLLVDWQNDSTDFVDNFVTEADGPKAMMVRFEHRMPECHGFQYADGEHFLKTRNGQTLCANRDWSEAIAYLTPENYNDFVLPLAALCARFSLYETLLFHASLVSYKGCGVMFIGPSGVGKTTQAKLWNRFLSAEIINGDKAFVRKTGNGFNACGLPWRGSSEYCLNKNVPLKGIVLLKQSDENRITGLDASATENVMPHAFLPYWDKNCLRKALSTFDDLVQSVPVWLLDCRADEAAVKLTVSTVLESN